MYIWKTDSSVAFTYLASYQNISPAHERCVGARVCEKLQDFDCNFGYKQ